MNKQTEITIYTDGGSRGNPGPSGVGAVIEYQDESKEYAESIGRKTNNESEYMALILALKKAKLLLGKAKAKQAAVNCYADSELLVKQLNHQYKIKNKNIQPLFLEIWNLTLDFGKVSFSHIRREQNKRADQLANQAMDRENNKLF